MTDTAFKGSVALRAALFSSVAAGMVFGATPAFAQAAPTTEPQQEAAPDEQVPAGTPVVNADGTTAVTTADTNAAPDAGGEQSIVVTGSRIRRPNLESNVPITSITGESLFTRGDLNIGDTLNDLPQLRNTRQQNNSNLAVGVAGLNLLDLRGLGTVRTLVLVNGRRHVGSDITSTSVSVDVNSIPADLIERVDIVTGGSSAVYGSNAIAGVVNFILRREFKGLQVRGHGGLTEEGAGKNYFVSAMGGTDFAGGRGNVILHGEYFHHDRVYGYEVPHIRRNDGLFVTDIDPTGLVQNSDGFADRTYLKDVRSATISPFGLVPINQRPSVALCGTGLAQTNGPPSSVATPGLPASANGTPYNCNFLFDAAGNLTPQTGTRFGQGITGGFIGGNGSTQREDELVTVYPRNDRFSINLISSFEVSEALEPFVEAKFTRVISEGGNAGPTGINGQRTQFDFRERIRLDNPFLAQAARTTISSAILASGCTPDLQTACTAAGNLTTADRAAIANGSYRFVLARNLFDLGPRQEKFTRDTYRIVTGLRGTFNSDWSYELSANYGRMEEETFRTGYLDRQRFLLSLDAGRNPATGQIECRAKFDPAAAVAFDIPGTAFTEAQRQGFRDRLAADIAACVPYNPFGAPDNSAAVDYFSLTETNDAVLDQLSFLGFVSGDSSQLFELPGGPIGFAVGAEYRREGAELKEDPFTASGATNSVSIGNIPRATQDVKEAFAELQIPFLRNRPFFEELSATVAGRVASYGGSIGTVYAYNAGAEWAPFRAVRFRANYGQAVRAPNLAETSFPIVNNFAPSFQDPCRANNISSGTEFRAANCAADLGALLTTPTFANQPVLSPAIRSGSNPDLKAETSKSLTLGAVVQPFRGVSFSVDYYNIKVDDVIVSPGAQAIVNACYDSPSLQNQFCSLFTRYRGATTSPAGEFPGRIAELSLFNGPLNYAKRVRRGLDFEVTARHQFSPNLGLDTKLVWAHILKNSDFQNPALPDFENANLREVGTPKNEAQFDAALSVGALTFGYGLHYIDEMVTPLEVEDITELQGRAPQNSDYADILEYPATFYHSARLDVDLSPALQRRKNSVSFYVGVDNILDTVPPLGLQGNGERSGSATTTQGTAIYESFGRRYFAGFKVRY